MQESPASFGIGAIPVRAKAVNSSYGQPLDRRRSREVQRSQRELKNSARLISSKLKCRRRPIRFVCFYPALLSEARSVSSILDCHPGPFALNASSTSRLNRIETATLVGAFCGDRKSVV